MGHNVGRQIRYWATRLSLCVLAVITVFTVDGQTVSLTNATLFRTDTTGTNLGSSGGIVLHGAWTTVLNEQYAPGGYGAQLFLSNSPNPGQGFFSPAANLSQALLTGIPNTIYFWADGDDTAGGSDFFGLNLYFNNAAASTPAISAYTTQGTTQVINIDRSTICTAGYDFKCVPGAGEVSFPLGTSTVTLSDFKILGIGGAATSSSCVDLVNNAHPTTLPPQPDGVCDTYGQFTITVSAPQFYYFPQLTFGGGWQSTLTYINYSFQEVNCVTNFYSDSGAPLMIPFAEGVAASRSDTLQPGHSIHDQTTADAGGANVEGWAIAECSSPIKASLLYRLYQQGAPIGEAGVNGMTSPASSFVTYADANTGVAFANPSSSQPAVITFRAISSGTTISTRILVLPPLGHSSANLGPFLGVQNFTGFVEITAAISPIVSLSLNAEAFPSFSSLPPGELSSATPLFQ